MSTAPLGASSVPPTLLFVCHGNVCRSPWAERMVRYALRDLPAPGVLVASAGTHALTGQPVDSNTAALLKHLNLDPQGHTARQLTPQVISGAALILTATRSQRSEVVLLHPPAVRRTLTIRQLGRLLTRPSPIATPVPGESVHEQIQTILRSAAQRRAITAAAGSADDDVVDPYRAPTNVQLLAARQMQDGLRILCMSLLGPSVDWPTDGALE